MKLTTQMQVGDGWQTLGTIGPADQPGSLSSQEAVGREVFVFGWLDGQVGVWRSIGGLDSAIRTDRVVSSIGFELVDGLSDGPFERDIVTERGVARRIRWSLTSS